MKSRESLPQLIKAPTGIAGLDDITGGGLPSGRPTLVCGNTGCGKTLLAMQFLVNGATRYDETGVFMTFEESRKDLTANVASLGYDLSGLIAEGHLRVDHVELPPANYDRSGEYDLEGLFIRLAQAIDQVAAKRVVLDTLETLFSGLPDPRILRAEIRRLCGWLKERGVTAIITGETGDGNNLTRQGLEEYVSDCVILLDHRVEGQVSSRRLRIVKYRGSAHGTNEYPFLIEGDGISLLPITSLSLNHTVSDERVSSGIAKLDAMLGGAGYFRGSSVLVSGTAGVGKSSLAAHLVDAFCGKGERAVYFSFEESASQIMRNMRSIGIDLSRRTERGLLQIRAERPSSLGLEMHLLTMIKSVQQMKPHLVIIDPLSSFLDGANNELVKALLMRLVDYLKVQQITGLFLNLTIGGDSIDRTDAGISSIMDTWILLKSDDVGDQRIRSLAILKSRGMPHSSQIREFLITDSGVDLGQAFSGRRKQPA